MDLNDAKKEVDRTLASLFYDRMKDVGSQQDLAQQMYKQAAQETGELLLHMRGRLDILFGHDTEALAQFLHNSGIRPSPETE